MIDPMEKERMAERVRAYFRELFVTPLATVLEKCDPATKARAAMIEDQAVTDSMAILVPLAEQFERDFLHELGIAPDEQR
jgi:hypothetical protein